MQAKLEHSLIPVSITITCLVLFGTSLLTWSGLASAAPVDVAFLAHTVQVQPIIRDILQGQPANTPAGNKTVQFPCQSDAHSLPMRCYGPYQIRQAYGVTDLLAKNITGQGSTITVIDAEGSSTIKQDLHAFDTQWGLPDPTLNVLTPFGVSSSDNSWRPEVSVDVEWAHVMAPGAAINLIVAKSSNDADLYYALKYAVEHNLGDVISLSFGENESCADSRLRRAAHQVLQNAAQKRITVLAATGDFGSAQYTCDNSSLQQAISFPADDPLITTVGGTALNADAVTGQYNAEITWNEADTFNKASGGGFSKYDTLPSYQNGVTG
ncbi:MAG: S53 family peptidase, partial [Ktedonobacteraceae bacterium]